MPKAANAISTLNTTGTGTCRPRTRARTAKKPGYDKWVDNNPVIQALKDGFTVTDWSYALEGYDGGGVKIKHTHTTIDDLCPAEQDAE